MTLTGKLMDEIYIEACTVDIYVWQAKPRKGHYQETAQRIIKSRAFSQMSAETEATMINNFLIQMGNGRTHSVDSIVGEICYGITAN